MITIELLKKKIDSNARLIGLDLGSKRIGVAICDDKRKISTPFKTIDYKNMQYLLDQLTNIIYENNVSGIIIGYPINMDGSVGSCLLYTSPSPRDGLLSRMPSSA